MLHEEGNFGPCKRKKKMIKSILATEAKQGSIRFLFIDLENKYD